MVVGATNDMQASERAWCLEAQRRPPWPRGEDAREIAGDAGMLGHILTHRARLHALITSCEKHARSSGKPELAGCLTRVSLIYSGRMAALPCQLRWHTLSYDA